MRRVSNIEFRWTKSLDGRDYAEIVKWVYASEPSKDFCFTLCLWRKGSEGWSLEFIGNRPFEYDEGRKLFDLMRYGQSILNAEWELEKIDD